MPLDTAINKGLKLDDGKTWMICAVVNGKRVRVSSGTTSEREAIKKLRDLETATPPCVAGKE